MEVQLLVGFAVEGLLDVFAIRDMPADGGVPAEREEVLVCAALLEVDVAAAVDDVEVDDRMQRLVRMVMHAAKDLAYTNTMKTNNLIITI